ncbi:hypothetical protein VFPFJ_04341 [Purpureocillium lilacinum]|uniref:Uncharacterized protein n=1 Tax=Purpureocillium lilacinum TaxID=33203 RepID=A0A179HJT1_PURLI|nr:hypothetical protein VFPFJ_04341 [Purpureocillium lilacinum]OAQ83400.1 hypothetical protein VFPBJ_02168 [Purpureocillium lilacinum]OAQ90182.1 hypothetical protein VFPFJ_04341 [Purpureocillium lilacinum]
MKLPIAGKPSGLVRLLARARLDSYHVEDQTRAKQHGRMVVVAEQFESTPARFTAAATPTIPRSSRMRMALRPARLGIVGALPERERIAASLSQQRPCCSRALMSWQKQDGASRAR